MADQFDFHEAANIFPLDEEHLDDLAADIKANGLHKPIELFGVKVLDGRRRLLACQRAGVEPNVCNVYPPDPVAYVLSLNLHRRHLDASQRGIVGAKAREIQDRQAKERQKAATVKGNKTRHGKESPVPVNLPELAKGDARDEIAKIVGVSGKTIDHATKVLKKGVPELILAVEAGQIAVSAAAKIAAKPDEAQMEEVQKLKSGATDDVGQNDPKEDGQKKTCIRDAMLAAMANGRWYTAAQLAQAVRKLQPEITEKQIVGNVANLKRKTPAGFRIEVKEIGKKSQYRLVKIGVGLAEQVAVFFGDLLKPNIDQMIEQAGNPTGDVHAHLRAVKVLAVQQKRAIEEFVTGLTTRPS